MSKKLSLMKSPTAKCDKEKSNMLPDNDPARGYYDRVLESGDQDMIAIASGVVKTLVKDGLDIEKFVKFCVKMGYGTEETMRKLLKWSMK